MRLEIVFCIVRWVYGGYGYWGGVSELVACSACRCGCFSDFVGGIVVVVVGGYDVVGVGNGFFVEVVGVVVLFFFVVIVRSVHLR